MAVGFRSRFPLQCVNIGHMIISLPSDSFVLHTGGKCEKCKKGEYDGAMCSELTETRVEKGSPTVAIGIYLRVLYALQLEEAEEIIQSVKEALKDWQKVAKRPGAQERDINLFSQRFITE